MYAWKYGYKYMEMQKLELHLRGEAMSFFNMFLVHSLNGIDSFHTYV